MYNFDIIKAARAAGLCRGGVQSGLYRERRSGNGILCEPWRSTSVAASRR